METTPMFDLAVTCGRFGHAHNGHKSLWDYGLMLCKRVYVIVGSAQERDTLRNPYPVETRIEVIQEIFPGAPKDRLIIGGLNDMTNELDITEEWGKYLKAHIINKIHKFPNLMIYGNDEFRSRWFAAEDLVNTAEIVLPRSTIPISGTMIRGMLVIGDEAEWQKWTPDMIHSMYPRLHAELMSVPVYKEIYDQVRQYKIMDMDAFMKVYSVYEAKDREQKLAAIAEAAKQ